MSINNFGDNPGILEPERIIIPNPDEPPVIEPGPSERPTHAPDPFKPERPTIKPWIQPTHKA